MLYVIHEMLMRHPVSKGMFVARCSQLGILSDEIEDFLQEWIDKEHDMDWCTDEDCKYDKKKHEKDTTGD